MKKERDQWSCDFSFFLWGGPVTLVTGGEGASIMDQPKPRAPFVGMKSPQPPSCLAVLQQAKGGWWESELLYDRKGMCGWAICWHLMCVCLILSSTTVACSLCDPFFTSSPLVSNSFASVKLHSCTRMCIPQMKIILQFVHWCLVHS